ncbi:hypothetical protein FZEAL_4893 [Fusarium zealandicum]|uniref:Uncharacterized protein n=1 Tax=Fusarium zealandicum TaxID=1053134 RepID=A0A8H4ULI5_9HYPO|nr:hypothetical protein FZEAL_4893 [Fusarium zealandicum]
MVSLAFADFAEKFQAARNSLVQESDPQEILLNVAEELRMHCLEARALSTRRKTSVLQENQKLRDKHLDLQSRQDQLEKDREELKRQRLEFDAEKWQLSEERGKLILYRQRVLLQVWKF